jgi:hypothetical protein
VSETTGPEVNPDPAPVTEPLPLADQSLHQPAPEAVVQKKNHTRTILEVVGGVVAVGLIVVSAAAGFGLGRLTSGDHQGFERGLKVAGGQGPGLQGPGQPGQGQQGFGMPGQGQQGFGMPGQQGSGERCFTLPGQGQVCLMIPGQQGQGMDPRGIDPDGDNWTGGGMMGGPQGQQFTVPGPQGTVPATPTPPTAPSPSSGT